MALPNLSGSNIQDTYQRVVHTNGTILYDGTGSVVLDATELAELQTLGSNNVNWSYLASVNQDLGSGDNVSFNFVNSGVGGFKHDYHIPGLDRPTLTNASGTLGFFISANADSADHLIGFKKEEVMVSAINIDGNFSGLSSGLFGTPALNISRITASGEISASGGIYANDYYSKGQAVLSYNIGQDRIVVGNKPTLIQGNLTASGAISASGDINASRYFKDGTGLFVNSSLSGTTSASNISASGFVSASNVIVDGALPANGIISASNFISAPTLNGTIGTATQTNITKLGTLTTLTSSGEISASGNIMAYELRSINGLRDNGNYAAIWNGTTMVLGTFGAPVAIRGTSCTFNNGGIDVAGGSITCSAEISTSGKIYFESIEGGTF